MGDESKETLIEQANGDPLRTRREPSAMEAAGGCPGKAAGIPPAEEVARRHMRYGGA